MNNALVLQALVQLAVGGFNKIFAEISLSSFGFATLDYLVAVGVVQDFPNSNHAAVVLASAAEAVSHFEHRRSFPCSTTRFDE
jgi:hypothetical protein